MEFVEATQMVQNSFQSFGNRRQFQEPVDHNVKHLQQKLVSSVRLGSSATSLPAFKREHITDKPPTGMNLKQTLPK